MVSDRGVAKWAFVEAAFQKRGPSNRRSLREFAPEPGPYLRQGDRPLLDFSSNDYLGLAQDPRLIAVATEATRRYGTGAMASRLVCGSFPLHQQLEASLAEFSQREAALLFSSGYQANATLLPTLFDRQSLVFVDRLAHNSLLFGIQASKAQWRRYRHNDYEHLEQLLQQAPVGVRLGIVSETVFSMDGDRTEVDRLADLADRYGAILYLDDAHALGVLGPEGSGLALRHPRVDVAVGTFGKACGSAGAFVVASRSLCDYWINTCPGLIYTTAIAPPVVAAALAAVQLLPELEPERQHLQAIAAELRQACRDRGWDCGPSQTQIVPLLVGESEQALVVAQRLEAAGILAMAIRPPTVPVGTARLRLVLRSDHQPEHLQQLVTALSEGWA
ncbi:aminotransferase class I/II-fold pyridoxal phosphate-dependent enzyme [Synechococcus elongatus]|uniref:8-amino-7-oxononanoate synthase n=1 Tax=Synechococcus elongatus PCC 11802 TaxID=2283154 RepID=A0AAT9JY69_SYNEL|nr:8-amino-7-oxononanoate synthase [Synechococcus elongatus]QFZ91494.1 8-amino-7-oxononanoate synthase [Synechococcus elongatus PCC 11802]